jgi:hypothetical protein
MSGLDNVTVRSARHQAILHLAGRGQLVSQPQSDYQQDNRNGQARNRATPVIALIGVGVGHRHQLSSSDGRYDTRGVAARYYHASASGYNRRFNLPTPPERTDVAPLCLRQPQEIVARADGRRSGASNPGADRQHSRRLAALPSSTKAPVGSWLWMRQTDRNKSRDADERHDCNR